MRAGVSIAAFAVAVFAAIVVAAPDDARRGELLYLLQHDCGSCHGMTRQGGLGPSLLPEALSEKSDALLLATILEGRPGTPMPPWRELLSEEDVRWLVEALRRGDGLMVEAPGQGDGL